MTAPSNRYRDRLSWAVDTLLDFDKKILHPRCIRLAFHGSKPDADIVAHAVSVMFSHLAGTALDKITIHNDIVNMQWSTFLYDAAYAYAAELIQDWRAHGMETDTSLYDWVMFYVHMLEGMAKDVPAYEFGEDDMVMRDGRLIPKVLDTDGVVLLPVP